MTRLHTFLQSLDERRFYLGFGHLAFVSLLLLSLYFYKERVLFSDMAFHMVYMINEETFCFKGTRVLSKLITQFPVLLGVYAYLPVKGLLLLYSLSIMGYFYGIYWIGTRFIPDWRFAVSMLAIVLFGAFELFFWPVTLLHQGLALIALFAALLFQYDPTHRYAQWQYMLLCVLIVLLGLFHPLIVFPLLFIIAWQWLDTVRPTSTKSYYILGLALLTMVVFFLKLTVFATGYSQGKMAQAGAGYQNLFSFFQLDVTRGIGDYFFKNYFFLPLLLLAVLYSYLRKQKYLVALFIAGCTLGYYVLVNLSFPTNVEPFYTANLYLPILVFITFPFIYHVLPEWSRLQRILVVAGLTLTGLVMVYGYHTPYKERVQWLMAQVNHAGNKSGQKFVIPATTVDNELLMFDWGVAYESLLWSACHTDYPVQALIVLPDKHIREATSELHLHHILTPWDPMSYDYLNVHYFRFEPHPYRVLKPGVD